MQLKFTDDLQTGHETIDNQHREIFKRLNGFWNAAKQGRGPEEVVKALIFLGEHIETHFIDEEKLQQEISYPDYEAHKKEHDDYKKEYVKLLNDLQKKGPDFSISIDTLNSMLEWVVKHIKNTDKQMVAFIQANKKQVKATT